MDLDSGRTERGFDMPLSDLGEPDSDLGSKLPWWIESEFKLETANGRSSDGFVKWIVQEAPGGDLLTPTRRLKFILQENCVTELFLHRAEILILLFKLTKDDVMEGFRFAICSMEPGEKAVFTIPQAWAVTKSGCPANIPWNIPPNQTLRLDIELISLITDITGDQGVIKKTIEFGSGCMIPFNQDEVLVKYNACLEDGSSVSKSEGVEFSLEEGFFCSAFARVVETMKPGEKAIVVIKPEYGFGDRGRPSTGNETAVPPHATLYVNLQLISWKIVTHIGENGEIVKRTLYEGNILFLGERPRNEAVVKVRLIGKLLDGTVFDRRGHNGDDPFEFTIDEEHVVDGLEQAVMTMAEGEVSSFTLPPQHAFGAVGSNQYPLAVIPPNSVVIYEIELQSVENEEYYYEHLDETVIAVARKKELAGDDLLNLGKYLRAYRRYLRARQILRSAVPQPYFNDYLKGTLKGDECPTAKLQRSEQGFDDAKKILISVALKSAECAMKLQCYKQASDLYNEVLKMYDPGNPKAFQMTTQSFPETPVGIDANAIHRDLETEYGIHTQMVGAPSRAKKKRNITKPSEGKIIVPGLDARQVPRSGSSSSTTTNEKRSSTATGGKKASGGSWFCFSS